jgi:hypothetical protein
MQLDTMYVLKFIISTLIFPFYTLMINHLYITDLNSFLMWQIFYEVNNLGKRVRFVLFCDKLS